MKTIHATELKNRLGQALSEAALGPLAIERHGRVVAYLVPPASMKTPRRRGHSARRAPKWSRREEERVIELCVRGDFRPSRWLRAGHSRTLAGVALMLASQAEFDRRRMLALAERLHPGMSTAAEFGRWLAHSPVPAARFLPMLRARMRSRQISARARHQS